MDSVLPTSSSSDSHPPQSQNRTHLLSSPSQKMDKPQQTIIPPLPLGYQLVDTTAPVDDFHHLRSVAAVLQITKSQIATSIQHTWFGCHITYTPPSPPTSPSTPSTIPPPTIIAMGRCISGGWVFHVVDMVVLPQHQRKGLGDIIFKRILREIEDRAPPGPTLVTLMADPPAQKLYRRNGFEGTPAALGMRRIIDVRARGSDGE
jgi:GNAT superfamily N-acetyltransferase